MNQPPQPPLLPYESKQPRQPRLVRGDETDSKTLKPSDVGAFFGGIFVGSWTVLLSVYLVGAILQPIALKIPVTRSIAQRGMFGSAFDVVGIPLMDAAIKVALMFAVALLPKRYRGLVRTGLCGSFVTAYLTCFGYGRWFAPRHYQGF